MEVHAHIVGIKVKTNYWGNLHPVGEKLERHFFNGVKWGGEIDVNFRSMVSVWGIRLQPLNENFREKPYTLNFSFFLSYFSSSFLDLNFCPCVHPTSLSQKVV